MVRTTPAICNLGLRLFLILSTVLDERADALERQELGLQRHQHGIDGDQRVQSHEAERGRAVDQDGGPARARVVAGRVEGVGQAMLAALEVYQLDLRAGERDRGRHDGQTGDLRGPDAVGQRRQAEQEFIGTG